MEKVKVSDIPDWVMGDVDVLFMDLFVMRQTNTTKMADLKERQLVANALLRYRNRAIEQSARIAEERIWSDADLRNSSSYEYGGSDVAGDIARSIRSLSKVEGK